MLHGMARESLTRDADEEGVQHVLGAAVAGAQLQAVGSWGGIEPWAAPRGLGAAWGRGECYPRGGTKSPCGSGQDLPAQPRSPNTHPQCRAVPGSFTALEGPSCAVQAGGSAGAQGTSRRPQGAGWSMAAPQAGGVAGTQGSSDSAVHRLLSSRQSSSIDSTCSRSLWRGGGVSPTSQPHCCPTAALVGARCPRRIPDLLQEVVKGAEDLGHLLRALLQAEGTLRVDEEAAARGQSSAHVRGLLPPQPRTLAPQREEGAGTGWGAPSCPPGPSTHLIMARRGMVNISSGS